MENKIVVTRITDVEQLKEILKPKKFDAKKYREENKDKFKQYNNDYQKKIITCTCGEDINYGSKRYHLTTRKHIKKMALVNQVEYVKNVIDESSEEEKTEDNDRYDVIKGLLIKINQNLEDLKFYKKDEYEGFAEKE